MNAEIQKVASRLAIAVEAKVVDKAQTLLRILRHKRSSIPSTAQAYLALELACYQFSCGFPMKEAALAAGLDLGDYCMARKQAASLVGTKESTTFRSLAVLFGATLILDSVDQLLAAYKEEFARTETAVARRNMDWDDENFMMAIFVSACQAFGVQLAKDTLSQIGGSNKMVKSYRQRIETACAELLAEFKTQRKAHGPSSKRAQSARKPRASPDTPVKPAGLATATTRARLDAAADLEVDSPSKTSNAEGKAAMLAIQTKENQSPSLGKRKARWATAAPKKTATATIGQRYQRHVKWETDFLGRLEAFVAQQEALAAAAEIPTPAGVPVEDIELM
ncbi:Origin of replication complex subunit 6 [Kappamyces sp. JEL0829]|nr:Origin of replication complex subunit 6 [Kappamyces sp. JEL0829]